MKRTKTGVHWREMVYLVFGYPRVFIRNCIFFGRTEKARISLFFCPVPQNKLMLRDERGRELDGWEGAEFVGLELAGLGGSGILILKRFDSGVYMLL